MTWTRQVSGPDNWCLIGLVKLQIIRRYHIQNRDDYKKYNKICGTVTKLVSVIKRLDPKDPTRIELTDQMLNK